MGTVVEDEESRGGTGARDGAAADSSTRNVGKKKLPDYYSTRCFVLSAIPAGDEVSLMMSPKRLLRGYLV
jgi:hypothetical protein